MTASMTRWRSESVKGVLGRVPQAELPGPDVDFPEANQSEVAADVAVPTIVDHEQTRKTATEMSLKVHLLAESCNRQAESFSRRLLSRRLERGREAEAHPSSLLSAIFNSGSIQHPSRSERRALRQEGQPACSSSRKLRRLSQTLRSFVSDHLRKATRPLILRLRMPFQSGP